jgi:hypothetical protein
MALYAQLRSVLMLLQYLQLRNLRATNCDWRWQQGTLHMHDLSLDPIIQSVT